MRNLVLIGYMGAGKTTAGARTAARLGMSFIDTDKYIVRMSHKSINEIFERYGEGKFRNMEYRLCRFLACQENLVIATGGGMVVRDENMRCLRADSAVIYLKGDADILYERAAASGTRPLAADRGDFLRLLRDREPLYEKYAGVTIDAGRMPAGELSRRVISEYLKM